MEWNAMKNVKGIISLKKANAEMLELKEFICVFVVLL